MNKNPMGESPSKPVITKRQKTVPRGDHRSSTLSSSSDDLLLTTALSNSFKSKKSIIPFPDFDPASVRMTAAHIDRRPSSLEIAPKYLVSESLGINKSHSYINFGETQCEFNEVVGQGAHGNLMRGNVSGSKQDRFVRKCFFLQEDGSSAQDKKFQLRTAVKEWFFYQEFSHKTFLFLNQLDYDDVMSHLRKIEHLESYLLKSIVLVSDSIYLNSMPRLVMPDLGRPFEKVINEDLIFHHGTQPSHVKPFKMSLRCVFQRLKDILDILFAMHQSGVVHGDAKMVNFVWDDHLCAHAVDFGYSYYMNEDQIVDWITCPTYFHWDDLDYLSRILSTRHLNTRKFGPFTDIYALVRYLSLYHSTVRALRIFPSSLFLNLSSFRLVELLDDQAYQVHYEANNFWVRALACFGTHDFKELLNFELDTMSESEEGSVVNDGTYSVMLVWLVCTTLYRETQHDVRLTIDSNQLNIRLYDLSGDDQTLLPQGIDGSNLRQIETLSICHQGIFSSFQSQTAFDESIDAYCMRYSK